MGITPRASNPVKNRLPSGEQFLFVRGTVDSFEVEFVDPADFAERTADTTRHELHETDYCNDNFE